MTGVLERLARRVGWTEGELWTVGLGLALATSLAVSTVPAAWERQPVGRAAAEPVTTASPSAPAPVVAAPRAPVFLPPLAPVPGPEPATPPVGPGPSPLPTPSVAPPPVVPVVLRGLLSTFATLPTDGSPGGLALGEDGTVLAATDAPGRAGGPSVLVSWGPTGALQRTAPVPGQPGDRSRGATAVAAHPDGGAVVADAATGRLLRLAAGGARWSVVATLPDLPVCLGPVLSPCQPGLVDTPPLPRGLVVDARGDVFVSDAGQGTVWRLPAGAPAPVPWYQSDDVLGPEGLGGLAVEPSGALLAVVTRYAGLQATGAGGLVRLARATDGGAGARTEVSAFAAGEDAVDVAVGTSRLYVALRGAHAVVVLGRGGSEELRFTGDALQAPTALAVAEGRVLVTTTGRRGAVLQVGVEDRPA